MLQLDKILEIKNLSIKYDNKIDKAVNNLSLSIGKGEIISIVGESGSGKSTLINSILNLLPKSAKIISGEIIYKGENIEKLSSKKRTQICGREISMIFQNTGNTMDPIKKIKKQYDEYILCHTKMNKTELLEFESQMLKKMKLSDVDRVLDSYPFQLSGGMQQRIAIAMAITLKPSLLLADEPTSALDVTVQSQVVQQLVDLSKMENTAMIFVTHNMGVASFISDKIAVMKDGFLVEFGDRNNIINRPQKEYTKKLIESIPQLGDERFAKRDIEDRKFN